MSLLNTLVISHIAAGGTNYAAATPSSLTGACVRRVQDLFDAHSSSASTQQTLQAPHLSDIGLAGTLAVLRTGSDMYKYTHAHGGHRRHIRHFVIKGTEADEALAWLSGTWLIRKERSVLLCQVVSIHFNHADLSSLLHPGAAMVDADRCFTIQYLESNASSAVQGNTVQRNLHLCTKTNGDYRTWRRGLQALLGPHIAHASDHDTMQSGGMNGQPVLACEAEQNGDTNKSWRPNDPSRGPSQNSQLSSAGTASVLLHGAGEGGRQGGGYEAARKRPVEGVGGGGVSGGEAARKLFGGGGLHERYNSDSEVHDTRAILFQNAYHSTPAVRTSVLPPSPYEY